MGQVPGSQNPSPFLIIGSGRVATHFAFYLKEKRIPYVQWSRNSTESLSKIISDDQPLVALLLLKDSVIENWIEDHPEVKALKLIHFSGCLTIPSVTGMHPLMSFGPSLYDLEFYEKIPFVCESGGPTFPEIFPQLNNPAFSIHAQDKALYHALCVLAGNFSIILWQKLFREFEEKLKIPSTVAQPYLEQITRNLINHPHLALTGPLQRKDAVTIEKNLSALHGDPFQPVYQAFKEIYS